MANTYHQVYLQTVFAVKYRRAVIDREWKPLLLRTIGNLINESECKSILVNGVEDHIHCLFGLKPKISIADVMKSVKAKSSKFINDNRLTTSRFEWQSGYGVFSYDRSALSRVYTYIENQEGHHRKQSFMAEYVGMLQEFKVEFDEQYLFQGLE